MLLEGIETLDAAKELVGKKLFLPVSFLPKLKDDQFYYHEIIGFQVVDENHGNIGMIGDILELPHQSLFQIRNGEKEILIPVVDDIIQKVDRKKKQLLIKAPEGLIEIYL